MYIIHCVPISIAVIQFVGFFMSKHTYAGNILTFLRLCSTGEIFSDMIHINPNPGGWGSITLLKL